MIKAIILIVNNSSNRRQTNTHTHKTQIANSLLSEISLHRKTINFAARKILHVGWPWNWCIFILVFVLLHDQSDPKSFRSVFLCSLFDIAFDFRSNWNEMKRNCPRSLSLSLALWNESIRFPTYAFSRHNNGRWCDVSTTNILLMFCSIYKILMQ